MNQQPPNYLAEPHNVERLLVHGNREQLRSAKRDSLLASMPDVEFRRWLRTQLTIFYKQRNKK
jgi:hypothetical protein